MEILINLIIAVVHSEDVTGYKDNLDQLKEYLRIYGEINKVISESDVESFSPKERADMVGKTPIQYLSNLVLDKDLVKKSYVNQIITVLLKSGADCLSPCMKLSDASAMHLAAGAGNFAGLAHMMRMKEKQDLSFSDAYGRNILHYLLGSDTDPDTLYSEFSYIVSRHPKLLFGSDGVVAGLLEHYICSHSTGELNPLIVAILKFLGDTVSEDSVSATLYNYSEINAILSADDAQLHQYINQSHEIQEAKSSLLKSGNTKKLEYLLKIGVGSDFLTKISYNDMDSNLFVILRNATLNTEQKLQFLYKMLQYDVNLNAAYILHASIGIAKDAEGLHFVRALITHAKTLKIDINYSTMEKVCPLKCLILKTFDQSFSKILDSEFFDLIFSIVVETAAEVDEIQSMYHDVERGHSSLLREILYQRMQQSLLETIRHPQEQGGALEEKTSAQSAPLSSAAPKITQLDMHLKDALERQDFAKAADLIQKGADREVLYGKDEYDVTFLAQILQLVDMECWPEFVRLGFDINRSELLHTLIYGNSLDTLKYLSDSPEVFLGLNLDMNYKDANGETLVTLLADHPALKHKLLEISASSTFAIGVRDIDLADAQVWIDAADESIASNLIGDSDIGRPKDLE